MHILDQNTPPLEPPRNNHSKDLFDTLMTSLTWFSVTLIWLVTTKKVFWYPHTGVTSQMIPINSYFLCALKPSNSCEPSMKV